MPIRVPCSCGKVLSAPDGAVGQAVTCPACKRTIVVPSPGAAAEAPAVGSGPPPSTSYDRHCPQCNAAMPVEAVICTRCGFDTRRGRFVSGDLGERKRFNYAAIIGPLAALVVIAAGIVFVPGVIRETSKRREEDKRKERLPHRRERRSERRESTTETEPAVEAATTSAPLTEFTGGEVIEEAVLGARTEPYVLADLTTIAPGGRLIIEAGVVIRGADGAAITLAGGTLLARGTGADPIVLAVSVSCVGPASELEATYCVFAHTMSLVGARKVSITNATFTAGARIEPQGASAPFDWRLDHCEFYPKQERTDPCLEVRTAVSRDDHRIWLRRNNYMGRVIGAVSIDAGIDLARSYWDVGPASALRNLERKGHVTVEPISSHRLAEAGVGPPDKMKGLLSPLGAQLIPVARERVLVNPAIGFEVVYPEGWRPAGTKILTAPSKFKRARVTFDWHMGETLAVRLRSRIVVGLRKSGITDLDASMGEPRTVADVDALDFVCSFASGGARWAERVIVIPQSTGSFTVTLRAREDDLPGLARGLDAILKNFRALGEK